MHTTISVLLKRCFLFGPSKVVMKKSSVENRQSSSGVPSEQLVDSWDLQVRLRRWRYEFSWQLGSELRCGVLTSGQRLPRNLKNVHC
jgi:hypothetical protein